MTHVDASLRLLDDVVVVVVHEYGDRLADDEGQPHGHVAVLAVKEARHEDGERYLKQNAPLFYQRPRHEITRQVSPRTTAHSRYSVPARLGKGQGAKEIGHSLERE